VEIKRLHDAIRNVQKIVNWKPVIDDLSSKINTKMDSLYTNLTNIVKKEIHTKLDSLYTNLTDIAKQEINATYNKINIQADNLYANLTKLMNQTIDDTFNTINIKMDNVSTKPTPMMMKSECTIIFTLLLLLRLDVANRSLLLNPCLCL
jgi:hypothetical protein